MQVGDLVKSKRHPEWFDPYSREWLGLVMEAEEDSDGIPGHWVEYFEDPGNWTWYSFDGESAVEVISASR